jgi:Na+-transporting methylmalonyl-CoA/oxaloacetate decarboxylase gamma subunit
MNDFTLSLQITALGMGLVFGAIILLWVLMILLTKFTADKDSAPDSPQAESPAPDSDLAQIAAIAVAAALAEQQLSSARPLQTPPTALVSAWQLGMRTRQMSTRKR